MPYSKLTFYKMPIMTKEKNFIIEDFENYLATLDKITVPKFMYVKPEQEQVIKIKASSGLYAQTQLNLDTNSTTLLSYFNYLKIQYFIDDDGDEIESDQKEVYYFINSWKWKAENTAEISLTMDVLNMIGIPSNTNKYCDWDPKTKIIREHQKRYTNNYWNVDRRSEGLNSDLYKHNEVVILDPKSIYSDSEKNGMKWYLVFANSLADFHSENNVIEVFLIPEYDIQFNGIGSSGAIDGYLSNAWLAKAVDPKIIKIIELPYCPSDTFTRTGENDWSCTSVAFRRSANMIQLYDLTYPLSNNFQAEQMISSSAYADNIMQETSLLYMTPSNAASYYQNIDATKFANMRDPKIYHSDFFITKIAYDSDSKVIKLEDLLGSDGTYEINFVVSKLLGSKFLFNLSVDGFNRATEDYPQALISNRDNSKMQFNYEFYNYRMIQEGWDRFKQQSSMGFSVLKTFGDLFKKADIGSTLNRTIGIGESYFNSEMSIYNTQERLKNQAVNVSGSNDLETFNVYSGNKLKRFTYTVSEEFKKILNNLFYYNGYIVDDLGVPNTNSRYWFNYVQCDPIFKNMLLNLAPGVWDLYKNKWREGITIFHYHANPKGYNVLKKWDIEQELENLESDLL